MTRVALAALATLAALACLPASGLAADQAALARAVEAIAPEAAPVPGGFRFRVQDVAVSVLADEAAGLLRVVARAGELTDREVRLIASALGPDMVPDLAARVVSVRGLMYSAVLAPLRGVTESILRAAVEGAAQAARVAARTPDPGSFGEERAPAASPSGFGEERAPTASPPGVAPLGEDALPGAMVDSQRQSGALE